MIDNQCVFYGIKLDAKPGDNLHCPLCDETLTVVNRNGRAWVNKHPRKLPANSWRHYGHRSGGTL